MWALTFLLCDLHTTRTRGNTIPARKGSPGSFNVSRWGRASVGRPCAGPVMKHVSLGIQRGEGGLQGSCASLPLFKKRAVFSLPQKGLAFTQHASLSVCSSQAQMLLKAGTLCEFVLTRVLRGAGLQSHISHRLKTQESAVFKSWKGTCQPRALTIFKICLMVPG